MNEEGPTSQANPFEPPALSVLEGGHGTLSAPFKIILKRWLFRSAINAPLPLWAAIYLYPRPLDLAGVAIGFFLFVLGIAWLDLRMRLTGRHVRVLQALARGSTIVAWLQLLPAFHFLLAMPVLMVSLAIGRVRCVTPALITVLFGYLLILLAYAVGDAANRIHNPYPKRD